MPDRRALITGIHGFCGRHLAAHLAAAGYEVHGIDLAAAAADTVRAAVVYHGDLCDPAFVQESLASSAPDCIFHLAALTNPQAPWEQLERANLRGTIELLEAMRRSGTNPTVLVAGSSAAYGRPKAEELPISERQELRPANPYAVSKVAQEMLAYSYFARYGIKVIRTRAFNLTGPGESAGFVTSAFARQIAEIEAGRCEPVVCVGNLKTTRDFTDVRDAMQAYRLAAEKGKPGEVYNVCSGVGTPVQELLGVLLDLSRVPVISVQANPDRFQAGDVPLQVGNARRLRRATGWEPAIPLRQTLQDVLDYWRQQAVSSKLQGEDQ